MVEEISGIKITPTDRDTLAEKRREGQENFSALVEWSNLFENNGVLRLPFVYVNEAVVENARTATAELLNTYHTQIDNTRKLNLELHSIDPGDRGKKVLAQAVSELGLDKRQTLDEESMQWTSDFIEEAERTQRLVGSINQLIIFRENLKLKEWSDDIFLGLTDKGDVLVFRDRSGRHIPGFIDSLDRQGPIPFLSLGEAMAMAREINDPRVNEKPKTGADIEGEHKRVSPEDFKGVVAKAVVEMRKQITPIDVKVPRPK